MSIRKKILGKPFADNALFVSVDSGQKITRLLFDCGEETCNDLSIGTLQKIDHLFFSHFHLDHIAGFDHFIRVNYDRSTKPVHIWGPPSTGDIIFHRLNSFSWNLIGSLPTQWFVHEVTPQNISTFLLKASEAFSQKHLLQKRSFESNILKTNELLVSVMFLEHGMTVLGFKIQEQDRIHIDKTRLKEQGLPEGPYLENVKNPAVSEAEMVHIGGESFTIGALRDRLLHTQKGDCLAYLTDFIFQSEKLKDWSRWLSGCGELICESQYLDNDHELAQKNFHLTTLQAAQIARAARAKKLTLMHFSRRYQQSDLKRFAEEARTIFPASYLPEHWG